MKSNRPGPPSKEGVGAVIFPSVKVEQGVALSPCQTSEQSLRLYEAFPWPVVG